MNNLNNLAQGMNIGDGAASAFIELSRTKTIGHGLFDYATDNRYRWLNTRNNFPRTASYYNIQRRLGETQMPMKRFLNGNLVSAYNIDGLDIGWAYTTDANANKLSRGYASSADFDEFQRLLRGNNLDENISKEYTFNRYNNHIDYQKRNEAEESIGKEYVVKENFKIEQLYNNLVDSFALLGNESNNVYRGTGGLSGEFFELSIPSAPIDSFETYWDANKSKIDNEKRKGRYIQTYKPYGGKQFTNKVILKHGDSNSSKGIYVKNSTIIVNDRFLNDIGHELYKENKNDEDNLKSFLNSDITVEGLLGYYKQHYENIQQFYHKQYKPYGTTMSVNNNEKLTELRTPTSVNGYTEVTIKDNGGTLVDGSKYTFYDEIDTPENTNVIDNFIYGTGITENYSNLLQYTNTLFKQSKIGTMINRFGANDVSRGRNLKKKNINSNESPYCRVWTAHHQYAKYKDTIRPFNISDDLEIFHSKLGENLRPNNAPTRLKEYSVLQDNGLVRITPQIGEIKDDKSGIKNYMFSIENLAWKDSNNLLSKEQRGPNGGRIMWFPPYNLKFNENVNVSWNGNTFIGRGEQIYTYVNTDRKGTLDFSILIDHPSILNKWSKNIGNNIGSDEKEKKKLDLLRFFAGCEELEFDDSNNQDPQGDTPPQSGSTEPKPMVTTEKVAYILFFPNNYSGYDFIDIPDEVMHDLNAYEIENNTIFEQHGVSDSSYRDQKVDDNISKFNLNNSGITESEVKELFFKNDEKITIKFFGDLVTISGNSVVSKIGEENKGDTIFGHNMVNTKLKSVSYYGTASSHGKKNLNEELSNRRANVLKSCIEKYCTFINKVEEQKGISTKVITVNDLNGTKDINSREAKLARAAYVIFELEKKQDSIPTNEISSGVSVNGAVLSNGKTNDNALRNMTTKTEIVNAIDDEGFDNEYTYFKKIEGDNNLVKHIVDKVKYFDPAYHSITPEGFNARLTFLQQCTRQGSTTSLNGGKIDSQSENYLKYAGNLSFGRAPFCVLRIGDFFNTKICIDSISINYDNNGGPQWDLNIEGAGVQPMMANVSMNFTFLGGQDLSGPIERLQNAISSNYYANASVYDKRAEINNK